MGDDNDSDVEVSESDLVLVKVLEDSSKGTVS